MVLLNGIVEIASTVLTLRLSGQHSGYTDERVDGDRSVDKSIRQYLDELFTIYEAEKRAAEQVAYDVADQYRSGEAGYADILSQTLVTIADNEYPVWEHGFSPTAPRGQSWHQAARIVAYDIRDHVRTIPFQELSTEDRDAYIDACAEIDYVLNNGVTGLGMDDSNGLLSTEAVPARIYTKAHQAYAEYETLVSKPEWLQYLRGDLTQQSAEPEWLTVFRKRGIGDVSP